MDGNRNIPSSSSRTGREREGDRRSAALNLIINRSAQCDIRNVALRTELSTSGAGRPNSPDHHSKMESDLPVRRITRGGRVPDYKLIRCRLSQPRRQQRFRTLQCCAFEPDPVYPELTNSIAAICGAEALYLLDCSTGVMMYENFFPEENFRALAWTTLKLHNGENLNVLAAGGDMRSIRLLHSPNLVTYAVLLGHSFGITCLTFHPKKPSLLFSGDRQGYVYVWNLGIPTKLNCSNTLLMQFKCPCPDFYPILNLVVMPTYDTLLVSCGDSIFAWVINDLRQISQKEKEPPASLQIKVPTQRGPWFDGLVRISDKLIVVNSIEEGASYVIDFTQVVSKLFNPNIESMTVEVLGKLRWLETEDIYVTIKARPGVGAVFSGNNKGGVWIYDVFRYVSNGGPHPKFDIPPIKEIEFDLSCFPALSDDKKMAGLSDITCLDITSDGQYLLFVTNYGHMHVRKRLK